MAFGADHAKHMEEISSKGLYPIYPDPYVFANSLAYLRNTHLVWDVLTLYMFGPLVSPQFPVWIMSLILLGNIAS